MVATSDECAGLKAMLIVHGVRAPRQQEGDHRHLLFRHRLLQSLPLRVFDMCASESKAVAPVTWQGITTISVLHSLQDVFYSSHK